MENNITPLEALINSVNQIVDVLIKISEMVANALVPLTAFQKISKGSVPNNYLKLHGKRTYRKKAIEIYERRHHSG